MFHLAPLSTRNQLGRFLTKRGLVSTAVEIGTHRGEYARILLSTWPGTLHCIDPWSIPPGYESQAKSLAYSTGDRAIDFAAAEEAIWPYRERCVLVPATSREAVDRFPDDSLDFCYIDGDHSFEAVSEDLSLWYPKLHSGGVLAGHDWLCPGEVDGGWGKAIQSAVEDFVSYHGLDDVYLIPEEGGLPWSVFVVKP